MIRRRPTLADVGVLMAAGVLLGVAAGPTVRARAFHGVVARAVLDVEALQARALEAQNRDGAWPTLTAVGMTPPELAGVYPGDSALTFDGYALEWRTLSVVDFVAAPAIVPTAVPGDAPPVSAAPERIPSPRRLGAIVLHASDPSLPAEMLARWGPGASFVRDTTWTLVIGRDPGRSAP
jgi:hypothetical protein